MVSLLGLWQAVAIRRAGGEGATDLRPLVRLNVTIVAADGTRMETGGEGRGGRLGYDKLFDPANWQAQVDEALRQALVNLESVPAPAGEMPVVLGPGWPGILLHEAIGHGLEGDFNRKATSAFAGLLGRRIASPGGLDRLVVGVGGSRHARPGFEDAAGSPRMGGDVGTSPGRARTCWLRPRLTLGRFAWRSSGWARDSGAGRAGA